jgi:hypothetical protein
MLLRSTLPDLTLPDTDFSSFVLERARGNRGGAPMTHVHKPRGGRDGLAALRATRPTNERNIPCVQRT